jgi:hypothetical protein
MNGEKAAEHAGVKERLVEELKIFWIITLYLAVLFGSFMVYRRLILAEFGLGYLHYGFAFIEALIIAKVILLGDAFRLGRRFEDRPLVFSVVYKSALFGAFVMLFGVLEHVIEGLFHRKGASDILRGMMDIGMDELLARVVMLIMAFIPFFAFWELGRVLGRRKLSELFFSERETLPA